MSMTKKHFEAIAEALDHSGADDSVIEAIADVCHRCNIHFDYDRFYKMAGRGSFRGK